MRRGGGSARVLCGLLLLLVVPVLAGCGADARGAGAPASLVRVAAAADLEFAFDDLAGLVAEEHPDIELAVTYGSSGTFLQQIRNGAPFDLYLSADLEYPRRLVEDGLAADADLFGYAVGRLVVWTPEGSSVDPAEGLAVLADPRVRRVSVANPEHAPYGRAAVAAMRTQGVYDAVAPKLVLGENVAQAAEFVQSGNADAGVVAMSLVLGDPLREVGRWAEVPLEDFPRLEQGGVVLASARDVEAARAVRDTVLGPTGRAVLDRYGFLLEP
jgi:molybdate transport system substrate-binding protein